MGGLGMGGWGRWNGWFRPEGWWANCCLKKMVQTQSGFGGPLIEKRCYHAVSQSEEREEDDI
jgi:hypothetical protein